MSAECAPTDGQPAPPSLLLELYGLSSTAETHPSIFYADRDPAALPTPASSESSRPFVTLTFAQSLDAKIAGVNGKQLILSGKESMIMTHWMRTLHDAILVGIGTALNDDPQLNTRHLPPLPADRPHGYRLPRPVVLDTHLRFSPDCKLLKNYQAGRGRRPWIVCAPQTASHDIASTKAFTQRAAALRSAGAHIIELAADAATGLIAVPDLLTALHELGVRSVMVEGGARVIRSFLSTGHGDSPSRESSDGPGDKWMVDALVVTVAPTLVGEAGVGYGSGLLADVLPKFEHVRTETFGPDAVMALRVL
ncbi:bacterial bifunctional deaminase-reductase [Polyporus arcularius HHB13444]|uniref:2,5-diamino-6-ribosylamino-4(3H)-pyrimidinone 5'-phosphate reductase n=1 Tax=Polyporus arcularius HHB13444 TaxID=1314778 RepID=A0A5C3PZS1_9APHY|nr:bacterial bifunctional deaminase-reductase [Polyporus arcularius HHB13444]